MGKIVIAGAYDTKAEPLRLLEKTLHSMGEQTITIDTGVFRRPNRPVCDYPAEAVAEAAGNWLQAATDRAQVLSALGQGAAHILGQLHEDGQVGALVCMGGSNAAAIFTHLAPVLPIGVPKILMATVVAGDTRPLAVAGDVILVNPIVDIEGNNRLLTAMITRLAAIVVSARQAGSFSLDRDGAGPDQPPRAGLTMYGVTNGCVTFCRQQLEQRGWESLVFHANGTGGQSLETFATRGLVSAVLDITISELTDELFGGLWSAGPQRLTGAAQAGIRQVVAPGAIDMINFGPLETLPARFRERIIHQHNQLVTLVRTTPEENRRLGQEVAVRLGEATAPTVVLVPTRGFSALDVAGGPFYDPDAVAAFVDGVRAGQTSRLGLEEVDCHINEIAFARALVETACPAPPTPTAGNA